MSDQRCHKCGADLECKAGCSAHPTNWYCPQCDRIAELEAEVERLRWDLQQAQEENQYLVTTAEAELSEVERLREKDKRWQAEMDDASKVALKNWQRVKDAEACLTRLPEKWTVRHGYDKFGVAAWIVDELEALIKEARGDT